MNRMNVRVEFPVNEGRMCGRLCAMQIKKDLDLLRGFTQPSKKACQPYRLCKF